MDNKIDFPIVSVVILTYNQEKFIEQSINGVLMQQCDFSIEILISDDCSTDQTASICKKYAENHSQIHFFQQTKNKGILDNYFDTLLLAKGKYIADCSGDDYWIDNQKLQRQVDILEKNPLCVLTHTNYFETLPNKEIIDYTSPLKRNHKLPVFSYKEHVYNFFNQIGSVFLCSACYSNQAFRSVYQKHESFFRNKKYLCEDFQLIFLLLHEGNFCYEPNCTTVYRILEGSISHTDSLEKQLSFAFSVFQLRSDLLQAFQLNPLRCTFSINLRLKEIFSLCIRLNNQKIARATLGILQNMNYSLPLRIRIYKFVLSQPLFSFFFRKIKGD